MFQKGRVESLFTQRSTRPPSRATELSDTDFEDDDISDFEEYAGRRSEESFGNQSNTTASTFEELRTPASNDFSSFNFQIRLDEKPEPTKPVEGPVGPHLFRISQESAQEPDIYLEWSPVSPEEYRAGPKLREPEQRQSRIVEEPLNSVAFESWTPSQVAHWMVTCGFDQSLVEKFRVNDISGAVLKDLQFGNLKELGIESFGQRHQLWDKIRTLRGALSLPSTPGSCSPDSPKVAAGQQHQDECSNETSPDEAKPKLHHTGRRRARRALRADDVISPGDSASIVAIEQLLPKLHHCSKGENCKTKRKQQKFLARIDKEFPVEMKQIGENNAASSEVTARPPSEVVPSVVASSDLLGPGRLPALRINEEALKVVQTRDPQENVRQFINFQHLNQAPEEPSTPPYEMFPPLSPPANTQAPHGNLSRLPKLTIPAQPLQHDAFSPNRTVRPARSPITAMDIRDRDDIFRFGSPASAMDIPVTAIPLGPIARDASQSVPPDMRFGEQEPISRSVSRAEQRHQQIWSPIERPQTAKPMPTPISRSASRASSSRRPTFVMPAVEETSTPIDDEQTPTTVNDVNHAGWMKKRKTKMLRHEWHENHFRLNGTRLAMHRDSKALDALEYIDVDEFAVACSSLASNKLNTAFKSLKLSGKKDKSIASAFEFQLVPAAEKKGMLGAATGKTHHFAVKTQDERIDWMRELMLAKALRQKAEGCEINVNGNMI